MHEKFPSRAIKSSSPSLQRFKEKIDMDVSKFKARKFSLKESHYWSSCGEFILKAALGIYDIFIYSHSANVNCSACFYNNFEQMVGITLLERVY